MEFEPLFTPGIKDIDITHLNRLFLDPFAEQIRRQNLINNFGIFLDMLRNIGISFEAWIDGSFATKKEEPNDIDIVFFYNQADLDSLSNDKKVEFENLKNHDLVKHRYNCDVYFVIDDIHDRGYWRGMFGFDRNENPKGIARIRI